MRAITFRNFHVAKIKLKYYFEVNQIILSIFSLVDPSNIFSCALVNFLLQMSFPFCVVLPQLLYVNVMALLNVTPYVLVYTY